MASQRALTVRELQDVEAEAAGWLYGEGAGRYLSELFGMYVAEHRGALAHLTLSEAKLHRFDGDGPGIALVAEDYRRRECEREGHRGCLARV